MGVLKSLTNITDDDRIAIPAAEYRRIATAKRYYANDFAKVKYKNSYGEKCERQYSSINVTKMAARRLASVIFNEQCSIAVSGNDNVHALIDQVLADNDFFTTYEERLETWLAFGSDAIRPYVQDDKIKLSWINADQFYPLQVNTTEVNEAAIADRTMITKHDKTLYYTLLEFHQWVSVKGKQIYKITNELYESEDADIVGVNVPLKTLDKYQNIQPVVLLEGLQSPLFAYFRTPGANNKSLESPLGLGIVDNALNTVDAINQTHDQFVHEVEMGKQRIAVPAEMLRPGGEFKGQKDLIHPPVFDKNVDVYEQMYGDPSNLKITNLTTPIRNVQYQATMSFFLREFENETGLSQGTFTTDESGVKTATEVVSNNSMTYQTRSSYLTQVQKQLEVLVKAILYTAQNGQLFTDGVPRWNGDINKIAIDIDFNDGVFVDQEAQNTKDLQSMTAGALPKIQYLVRNYQIDEKTAQQWLQQVQNETPEPSENAELGLFGGAEDGDDTETDARPSE